MCHGGSMSICSRFCFNHCSPAASWKFIAVLLSAILTFGCTHLELEDKAEAYNSAIGDSNNTLILLNAVRASQRAPMAFTGLGDISASPTFSGSAQGTFNFDPAHLTTYSANPQLNVGGGFTTFA